MHRDVKRSKSCESPAKRVTSEVDGRWVLGQFFAQKIVKELSGWEIGAPKPSV
jgi:hypothetical protein